MYTVFPHILCQYIFNTYTCPHPLTSQIHTHPCISSCICARTLTHTPLFTLATCMLPHVYTCTHSFFFHTWITSLLVMVCTYAHAYTLSSKPPPCTTMHLTYHIILLPKSCWVIWALPLSYAFSDDCQYLICGQDLEINKYPREGGRQPCSLLVAQPGFPSL